jgi:two-component system chemotaxis response regulator CheB
MKQFFVSPEGVKEYDLNAQGGSFVAQDTMTLVVLSWPQVAQVKVVSFFQVANPGADRGVLNSASWALFLKKFEDLVVEKVQNKNPQVRLFAKKSLIQDLKLKLKPDHVQGLKFIEIQQGSFEIRVQADGSEKVKFFQESTWLTSQKTKVMIVDDSKTMRDLLAKIIQADPQLECVAQAELPSQVESLIERHKPDVLTLDINMPEMDGVTLLEKLLPKYGIPTLMISAVSLEEGHQVLKAMRIGAVDYIQKPHLKEIPVVAPMIIEKIKMAAKVKVQKVFQSSEIKTKSTIQRNQSQIRLDRVLAIGASTGGTEAIREVLERLPEKIPPVVITQHIPPVFSKAFASRLNELLPYEVLEAKDGDELKPGRVLIAPGGYQMKVKKSGPDKLVVSVVDEAPVNRHKPSVDVLFESVAKICGRNSVGVILTGMGADGAKGLLEMKKSGALTVAQSEKDCVVFGMPREAIELGAATEVAHLFEVSNTVVKFLAPPAIIPLKKTA